MDLIRTHPRNVLLGLGARHIEGVTFNTFGVFIIAYVTTALGQTRQVALTAVIIASLLMIVMLPIFGTLSDRYGRRVVFGLGALAIGLLVFPAFWLMEMRSPVLIWIAVAIPFAFVYPAVYGPEAALFAELFDTRVRYSVASPSSTNSPASSRAGSPPILATAFLQMGGNQPWLFCLYVLLVSLVSAVSVYLMQDTHRRDIRVDATASPVTQKAPAG